MKKNLILISLFISFSFNVATFSMDSENDQHNSEKELFKGKMTNIKPVKKVNNGWYDARLITLNTHVYLKNDSGYELHAEASETIQSSLYKQAPTLNDSQSQSHALLKTPNRSLGASVDTSIQTPTQRKDEQKQTHIQYDKNNIQQAGKDFKVDLTRVDADNKPTDKVNYDGGHLVDHKFSAQGSHTDNSNYVPQHHYYNRWLKEYVVKNVSGYLEIPLFTPNPPLIKVMNENRLDPIPIGILLVPLDNLKIQAMYYFPNNQYNYRTCQVNLKIKDDMDQKMIPLFKLDGAFHDLLWPAIIHDISQKDDKLALQIIQENKGIGNVEKLVEGMSFPDLNEEEEVMATLTSNVIHQSDVDLSNILNVSKDKIKAMKRGQSNQGALQQSFNVLGQFLIDYALKNALKSEILSTHSRIIFANIITDFIECHDQVSEKALERVDTAYGDLYPSTLKGLSNIKEDMNLRDLIYYANLYQKLSSPFMDAPLYELAELQICDGLNITTNTITFINILNLLYTKTDSFTPNLEQLQNLIDIFLSAQESISYIICIGCPTEELEKQMSFLRKAKERVLKWDSLTSDTSGTYQTSPNSDSSFRMMPGYRAGQLQYLGTASSACYHNDDEDLECRDNSDDEDRNNTNGFNLNMPSKYEKIFFEEKSSTDDECK